MSSLSLHHRVYARNARLHGKDNDARRMLHHLQDHGKVMVLVHSLLYTRCQPSLSIATSALGPELNGSSHNSGECIIAERASHEWRREWQQALAFVAESKQRRSQRATIFAANVFIEAWHVQRV